MIFDIIFIGLALTCVCAFICGFFKWWYDFLIYEGKNHKQAITTIITWILIFVFCCGMFFIFGL